MNSTERDAEPAATGPSPSLQETPRDDAYRAFRQGRAVAFPLANLGPLRVTGADRVDFVHGQVTCDVRRLAPGGTAEGLLLNHKGHALAQLRVVRRAEDLYVAVEAGAGPFVAAEFERHIIFDDVDVADLRGTLAGWSLQGKPTAVNEVLAGIGASIPEPGGSTSVPFGDASLLIVPARRSASGGVDLHVLERQAAQVIESWAEAGAAVADPDVADLLRVDAGIPHAAREGGEGVLPQEAGLDAWISYSKGCYLGQEIMARIEARGSVRRHLVGVALDDDPSDRDLVLDDRVVGRLGTVVRHPDGGRRGLAVVRKDVPGEAELRAGETRVRLVPRPTP